MITSLEFYSGIGGMHYGLKESVPDSKVLAAFDINTTANFIYKFNFPDTNLHQSNIQALSVELLDKLKAELWTMSPPCQPFTKKGLQLWEEDRRSDSFCSLLEKLGQMSHPPKYLFLENVIGFETSSVHLTLLEKLQSMGYKIKEYILSPIQYGVPNSRPRYYLLASLSPSFEGSSDISKDAPVAGESLEAEEMSMFLEDSVEYDYVDCATIAKYGKGMDLVTKLCRRSACFTKSYGSYINGCGSFFCPDSEIVEGNKLCEDALSLTKKVLIRRFTPREMANLMCFPKNFHQPPGTTNKQMYRTLGNSVNVRVVAALLDYLLSH